MGTFNFHFGFTSAKTKEAASCSGCCSCSNYLSQIYIRSVSPQSHHLHLEPRTAQGEFKFHLFLPLIWSVWMFYEVEL